MKTLFIIITLLTSITSFAQNSSQAAKEQKSGIKDSVIIQKMLAVNLKRYRGKTIRSLLENDTIKLYNGYRFTDEPPGKLQSLDLTYPDGMVLIIYPYSKDGQAVQVSIQEQFDFEALKKVKIQKLVLSFEATRTDNHF